MRKKFDKKKTRYTVGTQRGSLQSVGEVSRNVDNRFEEHGFEVVNILKFARTRSRKYSTSVVIFSTFEINHRAYILEIPFAKHSNKHSSRSGTRVPSFKPIDRIFVTQFRFEWILEATCDELEPIASRSRRPIMYTRPVSALMLYPEYCFPRANRNSLYRCNRVQTPLWRWFSSFLRGE